MTEKLEQVEHLRAGVLFDVFRAKLAGQDVFLKRIAGAERRQSAALAARWTHSNETNVFTTCEFGWSAPNERGPSKADYEMLLRAEHSVIERAAPHWNHPGSQLSRWCKEDRLEPEEPSSEGELCLLMPWCQGHALAALSRSEQRRLFPSMLPSLWRALSFCPHGDLKAEDLLLDPGGSFFRILDPGVGIQGPSHARNSSSGLDFNSTLMTTNLAHYGLLLPEHGPKRPCFCAPEGGLVFFLETECKGQWDRMMLQAKQQSKEPVGPSAADFVALGSLYLSLLTGFSLSALLHLDTPLWTGFWSDRGDWPGPERPRAVIETLAGGALTDAAKQAGATPAETTLCEKLVMMTIQDEGALAGYAHEALRSLN